MAQLQTFAVAVYIAVSHQLSGVSFERIPSHHNSFEFSHVLIHFCNAACDRVLSLGLNQITHITPSFITST